MSLRESIRKTVRQLADMPYTGRLVRIAVAVWRGPETRDAIVNSQAQAASTRDFVAEQLPTLLETVSRLQHSHMSATRDQENLARSVPVALRQMRRDIAELQKLRELQREVEDLKSLRQNLESHIESVDYLLKRVEFVRSELMFEMRHGAKPVNAEGDRLEVEPRVVATDKLAAARADKLRVNLGCGHIALDGYINVDRRELAGVDIVSEVTNLPLQAGEVDEVFSSHLLEHFPQEQLRRELLPYWKSLLKPRGTFRAVVPDAEAMIREYGEGRYDYNDMREVLYGGQDYDGDFHFNMFTPAHMQALLEEAGFSEVNVVACGRRNGKCYEFEITAINGDQGHAAQ